MIGLLNGYRPLLAEEQNEAQRPLNLARAPHALYALLDNADAELEDTPAALRECVPRKLRQSIFSYAQMLKSSRLEYMKYRTSRDR